MARVYLDPVYGVILAALITGILSFIGIKHKSQTDLEVIKTTAEEKAASDLFGAYDKFVARFSKQLEQERAEFAKKLAASERRNALDRKEWSNERAGLVVRLEQDQARCDERIDQLEAKVTSLLLIIEQYPSKGNK